MKDTAEHATCGLGKSYWFMRPGDRETGRLRDAALSKGLYFIFIVK
jgi:hypothetical protein